jgi:hypothetical protein
LEERTIFNAKEVVFPTGPSVPKVSSEAQVSTLIFSEFILNFPGVYSPLFAMPKRGTGRCQRTGLPPIFAAQPEKPGFDFRNLLL